ncbi:MAG: serine--tRNA ligase, partial [Candidatus Gracilibacteria bacterium]
MLDPKIIIQNPDAVREAARKKYINFDVDHFIEVDEKRRALQVELDTLRAEKNKASEKIQKLSGEEKKTAIAEMREQGDEEKCVSEKLSTVEQEWRALLLRAPGLISPNVPEGKDDTENAEMYTWGELPKFSFEPKDHITLGKALDIIDIDRGVKLSGSRSYFLKNEGMLLELAILQYTLNKLVTKGFTPFLPP